MQIDRVYDRVFPTCSSINQLNRLHILLENRMTPVETVQLSAHIRRTYDRRGLSRRADAVRVLVARATGRLQRRGGARELSERERRVRAVVWAAKLTHHLGLARTSTPSPVTRRWLRGGAAYYQAPGSPSSVLAIGFTGNARRMMMSTPQFLQHLAPSGADLLLLDGARGSAYGEGVRGFSDDFPGTVDWLRAFIGNHGAEHVVTVGTSGGGLPAVLSGLALQVHSVLAVGAVTRGSSDYTRSDGTATIDDVVMQYAVKSPLPRMSLVYGLDSAMDAAAAQDLVAVLPEARVITVEGAGHACLFQLAERGELEDLLATTLYQALPAADLMA
jgi:hypothetical protein